MSWRMVYRGRSGDGLVLQEEECVWCEGDDRETAIVLGRRRLTERVGWRASYLMALYGVERCGDA